MTTTSSSLNIAIVGSGCMGLQHARVTTNHANGVRLAALIDQSPSSLEAASEQFTEVPAFTSLAEAVDEIRIDAVHVCTPQYTHFAVADEAIRAGCHTLVEKPFTPTVAEARRLFAEARERGLSVCAGHQLMFEGAYQQLLQQIPLLNEIVHIECYFAFAPSKMPAGRPGLNPDHQLMDILPHPVYQLLEVLKAASPGCTLDIGDVHLGGSGTLHALLRRGNTCATLVVTLSGRPVENTLRIVGTGGEIVADLVRGIVCQQLGPGRSAIDKVAAPYLQALQATTRTTGALVRRALRRQRYYPSLTELITRWYASIQDEGVESPTPEQDVLDAVETFEVIVERTGLGAVPTTTGSDSTEDRPLVVVTGGTGWLGTAVTRELVGAGARVAAISRRHAASWQGWEYVEHVLGDLADPISLTAYSDAVCVVHCAAEVAGGGKDAHQRNSIRATQNLISAMREAELRRLVHVSSLAVLSQAHGPVTEDSPMVSDAITAGPYTWGKAESEKLIGEAEDIDSRIVRPAAIIDSNAFVAPGKLGKRVGPLFVAVGGLKEVLGVVELDWAARALAWMALNFEEAPDAINLLDPELPTRRDLIGRLRASNPTLTVLRLPRLAISVGGLLLVGASRVLRPGKKAIDIRRVFARQSFDTTRVRNLQKLMLQEVVPEELVPKTLRSSS